MHKGVIMLVKAESKDEAISEVRSFVEDYEGQVWDWWVIGGRWNKVLHPLHSKFSKTVEKAFKKYKKIGQSMSNDDTTKEYQLIWELIGGTGNNPYSDDAPYNTSEDDNVYLATDCKATIKEWTIDMEAKAESFYKAMYRERKKETAAKREGKKVWPSSAYYAKLYSDCKYDNFSFESGVYDISNSTNNVPKDLTGYYAVMIDMHN